MIYGIGDAIEESFVLIPKLGNLPNVIFILVIFGAFVYWLMQLNKFKKNHINNGDVE